MKPEKKIGRTRGRQVKETYGGHKNDAGHRKFGQNLVKVCRLKTVQWRITALQNGTSLHPPAP